MKIVEINKEVINLQTYFYKKKLNLNIYKYVKLNSEYIHKYKYIIFTFKMIQYDSK